MMDLTEIRQSPEKALELILQLSGAVEKRDSEIEQLQEELRLALYRKFGRSSEKADDSQRELFEEHIPESEANADEEETTIPSHTRKKAGRKPLDPSIPREVIVHDIPEEEKICGCGHHLVTVNFPCPTRN